MTLESFSSFSRRRYPPSPRRLSSSVSDAGRTPILFARSVVRIPSFCNTRCRSRCAPRERHCSSVGRRRTIRNSRAICSIRSSASFGIRNSPCIYLGTVTFYAKRTLSSTISINRSVRLPRQTVHKSRLSWKIHSPEVLRAVLSEENHRRGMGTSLKQRKSSFCSRFTRKGFSHRLAHETPLSSAFRRESPKTLHQKHHYRHSGTAFGRKTLLYHPCESSSTGWGAKAKPSSSNATQASTTAASNCPPLPAASSASTTLRSWAGR